MKKEMKCDVTFVMFCISAYDFRTKKANIDNSLPMSAFYFAYYCYAFPLHSAFNAPFSTSIRMVSPAPTWSAKISFAAKVSTVFCR